MEEKQGLRLHRRVAAGYYWNFHKEYTRATNALLALYQIGPDFAIDLIQKGENNRWYYFKKCVKYLNRLCPWDDNRRYDRPYLIHLLRNIFMKHNSRVQSDRSEIKKVLNGCVVEYDPGMPKNWLSG